MLLSSLFLLPFLFPASARAELRSILGSRRSVLGLVISGLLVGGNWYLYVWAVTHDHVIDSSLGYFINPLMNVALGTLLLGEMMRPAQKLACALAAFGVLLLGLSTGIFPWIACLLALSFALYGLARKLLAVPTLGGTFFETVILAPFCLAALLLQTPSPAGSVTPASAWFILLFSGAVTTIPLLAFAEAAKKLPLSTLAFFQFLSPSLQFFLGVFVYEEPFSGLQWLSFSLILSGLSVFLVDQKRKHP